MPNADTEPRRESSYQLHDSLEMEYRNLTEDLARYENQGFKVISAFGFLVSATFAVGVRFDIGELFVLIPYAGLTAIQMLISINYAYRVREEYLRRIERETQGQALTGQHHALRFYSQVQAKFLHGSHANGFFLPLHGFVGMGIGLICILIIYGTQKGFDVLYVSSPSFAWLFMASVLLLFAYSARSFSWSLTSIRSQREPNSATVSPGAASSHS